MGVLSSLFSSSCLEFVAHQLSMDSVVLLANCIQTHIHRVSLHVHWSLFICIGLFSRAPWKETYEYEKRPMDMKRQPINTNWIWKETYEYEKRPMNMKRDQWTWKENLSTLIGYERGTCGVFLKPKPTHCNTMQLLKPKQSWESLKCVVLIHTPVP